VPFRVALAGENVRQSPAEFEEARARLGDRIVQYGYMDDFAAYARLLWQADIVVSTAHQDFFGGAVTEAIYCGCVPLMARRLNYPYLLPEEYREVCTFKDDDLVPQLRRHLRGEYVIDRDALRSHVAGFDWQRMAPQYDATLAGLILDE
jgi:glycosyltransferase involved in cell wall biosynthesis